MSTKVTNTDHYAKSPDDMIAMIASPEFLQAKYTALADRTFEVVQQDAAEGSLTVQVNREVDANLPDIAKKVLGETNHLVQTEKWRKDGAGWKADVTIDSPGKPIAIAGTYDLNPAGDGSDWVVNLEIKSSVPLVGGKIEKMVADETKSNFVKEYDFMSSYIAGN